MNKAFFLDRDGVINVDHGYVSRIEEFEIFPSVCSACEKILQHDYKIIIVTNQAGIARGYYTEKQFLDLNRHMLACFSAAGIEICDVFYCPHHPKKGIGDYLQDCDCRKPKPGMIIEAARKHKIDLKRSVMVGDKPSDINAGLAAGIPALYGVLGNYAWPKDDSSFKVSDLWQAVDTYFS